MQSFPKKAKIRTSKEYNALMRSNKKLIGKWIIVDVAPSQTGETRLGMTVSRKFGKAHERNRFKRVVREGFRLCRERLAIGKDLNVRPRSLAKEATTQDIISELKELVGF